MKKAILIGAVICVFTMTANAQLKLQYTLRENNAMATWVGAQTRMVANVYNVDFCVSTFVGRKFELGVGLGLGTSNVACVAGTTNLSVNAPMNGKTEYEQTAVVPFFVQAKCHFNPEKSHLYLEGNLGSMLASADDAAGKSFNPLGVYFNFNVGGEIVLHNNDFRLFGSIGYRNQFQHVDFMLYEYSSLLNKYVYAYQHKQSTLNFGAIVVSVGVKF